MKHSLIPNRLKRKLLHWVNYAIIELILQAGPYEWMTYQEAYHAAIRIGSAMKGLGVNPVINLALFKILCMEKNIFAINLTQCFYSTRVTVVAYMGLTALNGYLQWRYDTEF